MVAQKYHSCIHIFFSLYKNILFCWKFHGVKIYSPGPTDTWTHLLSHHYFFNSTPLLHPPDGIHDQWSRFFAWPFNMKDSGGSTPRVGLVWGRSAPPLGQPAMALAINSLPPLPSKLAPQHIFTSLLSRIRVFDLLASKSFLEWRKLEGKS
jgi:hypothetical protein